MTERTHRVGTLALLPVLGLPLSAGSPASVDTLEVPGRATTRLSEHLDAAGYEGPLAGLEPAADVSDLEDPALDLLLDESFEFFEWEFSGWPRIPGAELVSEGENHHFELTTFPDGALGWVLPVQPDAFYRFQRSVRVLGAPFCDLYVVESVIEFEDARPDPDEYFLAGRGSALKVHGLPLHSDSTDPTQAEWQHGSTSFYPTPRTRSLVVLWRPRTGADPGATIRSMAFDDVRLEEVVPGRRERMRLLKGAHVESGTDPAQGLRKAGWLLPLPSPRGRRSGEPAESNYNWRRALYAPPTSELSFDLALPDAARLRLATGLARETPRGAAARFQVDVESTTGGGEPQRLLDVVRAAKMEEWHWEDVDLDLAPWAGQRVRLVLRTLAEKGDPHALWANPRIEAGADSADPLLILIAVDTLRADRLGTYGYERSTSPALDRLADEGVRFDQARSNCNWTCPSFASIFTGLVPSRHGVSSYGPATPLPDELVTLAEHFQDRGWATRSIAYKVPLFDGNYEQGFDEAFNVPRDVIRGEENLARALEWLDAHRGGPSFLFLHFNDPHQPFVQPAPFDSAFAPAPEGMGLDAPLRVPGGEDESRRAFADLYDGAVAYVDTCIGRFLDALRERELYDRAAIVFVADHGEQLWEHGRFGHGGADLYDEVVRVPLIVKPPAETFEAGQIITADVSGFDVMPTLLELGDVPPAGPLDARSLMPLIRGELEAFDRVVVTETSQRGLALVDGGYKFVLEPGGGFESLYHLAADPLEREDVAGERPEELARLRGLAIAYILEHRPGAYLLAQAGDESATLQVSSTALRTLAGARPAVGRDLSTVQLEPGSWALLELEDPDPTSVAVAGLPARSGEGAEGAFEPWAPGSLPSLQGPGVWRFHGPRASVEAGAEAEAPTVDAELLETLRALGYAE